MRAWDQRTIEEANLLNPAFCGALLCCSVSGYVSQNDSPMPLPLIFLPLPILLHGPTRADLPLGASADFNAWALRHRQVLVGFPARARSLVPYTGEALTFCATRGMLTIEGGAVQKGKLTPAKVRKTNETLDEIGKAAVMLGRWLAKSGSVATVYALWGIAP